MRENSKILITTGGGKVRQRVITQLAHKRVSARAGVHSQGKASGLGESGIEATVLDFESSESLAAAFKGIETLFLVTPGSPDQGRHEENLLAEAKRVGVKHVVNAPGKSPITTSLASLSGIATLSRELGRAAFPIPSCEQITSCRTSSATRSK